MKNKETWDFFVDTGGTFTDCLAHSDGRGFFRTKVLSRGVLSAQVDAVLSPQKLRLESGTDWPKKFVNGKKVSFQGNQDLELTILEWYPEESILVFENTLPSEVGPETAIEVKMLWEAPILAMQLLLARHGLELHEISVRMRLATTRCTNALLESSGENPVLFLTAGFPDLLEIGDQRRNQLFDLIPEKRKTLSEVVVEVKERIDRDGEVLTVPDFEEVRRKAEKLFASGYRCAAVSFLHSYLNPNHEIQVAEVLREIGFEHVIESSKVSPLIKWRSRCESAVVESYLCRILEDYLDRVESELGEDGELLVNSSSGGLINRSQYRAVDSLLSGPAAGVVGASIIAKSCGFLNSINLDMGGTSTDVSRCSGGYSYQPFHQVGLAEVCNLALKIETVAAGGGSICWVEDGLLRVGPKSSGSYPGPACYGLGGPLCLTDINLLLGRLDRTRFSTPIVPEDAENRLMEMIDSTGKSTDDLLQGFLAIADESMANAIRKISIQEGYDPSDHALLAFGGAGGQHACGVAARLGMKTILSPSDAGLLSAFGLSRSRVERIITRSFLGPIDSGRIESLEREMIKQGMALVAQSGSNGRVLDKIALVRFKGQEASLEIHYQKSSDLNPLFRARFLKIFGYYPEGKELEVDSLRVQIGGPPPEEIDESFPKLNEPINHQAKSVIERSSLGPGSLITGPCLMVDDFGTLWIDQGWTGQMGDRGTLCLKSDPEMGVSRISESVKRELFSSRFLCLADEMGKQLERTAMSVNVRERLDFSCALLDSRGFLVANAPHIPVHLGAMGLFTRHLIEAFPKLSEGDILISNHPAFGGSHLPDISLLAPVFMESDEPLCFLANRAHHAEIGGIAPGSMPGVVAGLSEEGVILYPQYLFKSGQSRMKKVEEVLRNAEFPSRQVEENISDLFAQVASLRIGAQTMKALLGTYGIDEITTQMNHLRQESSSSCREFLKEFGTANLVGEQQLDDGVSLCLKVKINHGKAVFDFSGTGPVRGDNLNATEAIVSSVVCYCLRLLIGKNLPLNEGLLEPVEIVVPKGTLLNPDFMPETKMQPGVAGGNVEISQRLVDLIISSVFQQAACSQGTMNNLTFGNDNFSHYETLGGGAGAIVGHGGTSAVQVHMTNTAITDPEIMESSFPVRLLSHQVRKGSGGIGDWQGGDGVERVYLFEETTTFSFLTERRRKGAEGLHGGGAGLPGEQFIIRKNGQKERLQGRCTGLANPGDRLIIRTPGGGGVGNPAVNR